MAGLKRKFPASKTPKLSTGGENRSKYENKQYLPLDSDGLSEKDTFENYLDPEAFELFPERDGNRKRLIWQLFKWAHDEESYALWRFCLKYHMPESTLYRWEAKFKDVAAALSNVRLILGGRREEKVNKREFEPSMVRASIHTYRPEWNKINQDHADLRRNDDKQDGSITVVLQQVESTGKVIPLVINQEPVDNDTE